MRVKAVEMGLGLGNNYESAPWLPLEWCLNMNSWKGNRTDAGKKALILSVCSLKWYWLTVYGLSNNGDGLKVHGAEERCARGWEEEEDDVES